MQRVCVSVAYFEWVVFSMLDSLLLSEDNITSCPKIYNSLKGYTAFIRETNGVYLNAIATHNGFVLHWDKWCPNHAVHTQRLLGHLVRVLDASKVWHILSNAQVRGSSLPSCLLWLKVDDSSKQLHCQGIPTYMSLLSTFKLACDTKKVLGRMHARLILEAPCLPNADQLTFILHFFADTARHHFTSLCDGGDVRYFSETCFHEFDLLIQLVAKHKPYSIALVDTDADVCLYQKDIQHLLQPLAIVDSPIAFPEKEGTISVFQKAFACTTLSSSQYLIPLKPEGNLYKESLKDAYSEYLLRLKQKQNQCLPCVSALCLPSDFIASDEMLYAVQYESPNLFAIPQKKFALWLLDAKVDNLDAFVHILLRKAQEREPYTLPASKEVVLQVVDVLRYLLSESSESLEKSTEDAAAPLPLEPLSLGVLSKVRESIEAQDKDEALFLLRCCDSLASAEGVKAVRSELKERYGINFLSKHLIPYAPEETAYVIMRFLYRLSAFYETFSQNPSLYDCIPDSFKSFAENMLQSNVITDGVLLQFVLQKYVSIESFNKAYCLPLSIAGVSFEMNNPHDGLNMSPIFLLCHDYFFHAFGGDHLLSSYWVVLLHQERKVLVRLLESVSLFLLESLMEFSFLGKDVVAENLLTVFTTLIFGLFHESTGNNGRTRVRVLPSSCDRSYLEKKFSFFDQATLRESSRLRLNLEYEGFSNELKQLLPLKDNCSFTYFLACLLLDTVTESLRNANGKASVDISHIMEAFQQRLSSQEALMRLFEKNWDAFVENGIFPKEFKQVTSSSDRLKVLCLPNVQEMLYYALISWDLHAA